MCNSSQGCHLSGSESESDSDSDTDSLVSLVDDENDFATHLTTPIEPTTTNNTSCYMPHNTNNQGMVEPTTDNPQIEEFCEDYFPLRKMMKQQRKQLIADHYALTSTHRLLGSTSRPLRAASRAQEAVQSVLKRKYTKKKTCLNNNVESHALIQQAKQYATQSYSLPREPPNKLKRAYEIKTRSSMESCRTARQTTKKRQSLTPVVKSKKETTVTWTHKLMPLKVNRKSAKKSSSTESWTVLQNLNGIKQPTSHKLPSSQLSKSHQWT